VIVIYGMTLAPHISVPVAAVLKNIEVRGTTMGSSKEFRDMLGYLKEKNLHPIVSRVAKGKLQDIEMIDGLFEDMKKSSQFGKLVFEVDGGGSSEASRL
jgi:D-arabinose 1-dehydrogenase-like Zn-dependent alcohol dehydrogenase